MKIEVNVEKKHLMFFSLFLVALAGIFGAFIVYAQQVPNPGHGADRIGPGTFAPGNYVFPNNLRVNGMIGVNKDPQSSLDVQGEIRAAQVQANDLRGEVHSGRINLGSTPGGGQPGPFAEGSICFATAGGFDCRTNWSITRVNTNPADIAGDINSAAGWTNSFDRAAYVSVWATHSTTQGEFIIQIQDNPSSPWITVGVARKGGGSGHSYSHTLGAFVPPNGKIRMQVVSGGVSDLGARYQLLGL
jgi:hypothetical protein